MEEELDFAVKYPFSESAKASLAGTDLNERIIQLAVERIKKALSGVNMVKMFLHDSEKKDDVASFAAARMILGHLRNSYLTSRFAVAESKRARGYFDHEREEQLERISAQFGISCKPKVQKINAESRKSQALTQNSKPLEIDLPTYLRYSLKNPDYKLINRRLISGVVDINESEKKRLMEEAVRKHVESIPLVKDPPDSIKKAGEVLLAELPKTETKIVVKEGDHPPCIMRLMESIKKHENLTHHARWYLASYLIAIGMSDDDITNVYSNLPDFNEKITRYQVGHLRKKGYNVPSCATVTTYGLCCAVCNIGNPLKWHGLSDGRKNAVKITPVQQQP